MTASRKAFIVLTAFIALWLGLPMSGAVSPASAQVSVMTASPSVASQGTANLTVVILGKNFVKNAKATFYRTGTTDMGGVLVNRTTYKASTRLEAVVSVTESAALDYFDIQVALPSGAKAIGRVLFIVTPKVADPCAMPTPFRR